MKSGRRFLGITIALLAASASGGMARGQELVANGGFEQTSSTGCDFNLSNLVFNVSMPGATAFGLGDNLDIMHGACTYGLAPLTGNVKIGVGCVVTGQGPDALSLSLTSPIVPGDTYVLEIIGNAWVGSFSLYSTTPELLDVGISSSNTQFGILLTKLQPRPGAWTSMRFRFVSPVAGTHLTLRQSSGVNAWTHVDRVSLVRTGGQPGAAAGGSPRVPSGLAGSVLAMLLMAPDVAIPVVTGDVALPRDDRDLVIVDSPAGEAPPMPDLSESHSA